MNVTAKVIIVALCVTILILAGFLGERGAEIKKKDKDIELFAIATCSNFFLLEGMSNDDVEFMKTAFECGRESELETAIEIGFKEREGIILEHERFWGRSLR